MKSASRQNETTFAASLECSCWRHDESSFLHTFMNFSDVWFFRIFSKSFVLAVTKHVLQSVLSKLLGLLRWLIRLLSFQILYRTFIL